MKTLKQFSQATTTALASVLALSVLALATGFGAPAQANHADNIERRLAALEHQLQQLTRIVREHAAHDRMMHGLQYPQPPSGYPAGGNRLDTASWFWEKYWKRRARDAH